MKPAVYHASFLKKIRALFDGEAILNVIRLVDEDENLIDDVVFLELGAGRVVGFYANGMNPLISRHHVAEFDDFNLYALYSGIHEYKTSDFSGFLIDFSVVVFNPDHNEVVAVFLSSESRSRSVLLVFSSDEIFIYEDCVKNSISQILKDRFLQFRNIDFLVFERHANQACWINSCA